jgi:hypothetical protein
VIQATFSPLFFISKNSSRPFFLAKANSSLKQNLMITSYNHTSILYQILSPMTSTQLPFIASPLLPAGLLPVSQISVVKNADGLSGRCCYARMRHPLRLAYVNI